MLMGLFNFWGWGCLIMAHKMVEFCSNFESRLELKLNELATITITKLCQCYLGIAKLDKLKLDMDREGEFI